MKQILNIIAGVILWMYGPMASMAAQKDSPLSTSYYQAGTKIAVLKNNNQFIPIKELELWRPELVCANPLTSTLHQSMQKYGPCTLTSFHKLEDQTWHTGTNLFILEVNLKQTSHSELLILSTKLDQIGLNYIVIFLQGYTTSLQPGLFKKANAILFSWDESEYLAAHLAGIVYGARACTSTLPFFLNQDYGIGFGMPTASLQRLQYGPPELVGINGQAFDEALTYSLEEAIANKIFPGANILVAKNGIIIYQKAFGKQTYSQNIPLQSDAMYDLASITKVFGATLASMQLNSRGLFNPENSVSNYLPDFKKSNKARLKWKDILAHRARLPATITYYRKVLSASGTFLPHTIHTGRRPLYPYPVTDALFANKKLPSKLLNEIKRIPLLAKEGYVYSDLSMILLYKSIEKITKTPFDQYLSNEIYSSLGADHTLFLPLRVYAKSQVVPTEQDSFFRHTLVHGYVHDENASMLGGISGHAGLFSNTNDMAKIAQLLLNKGTYGGKKYMTPQTVELFTRYQYPELDNRRGLGWDKPLLNYDINSSPVARDASPESFGHSGFTGTFVWIDPKYQLTYILLTNRVHPTRTNNKISQYSIRPCIQQTIYDFILEAQKSNSTK